MTPASKLAGRLKKAKEKKGPVWGGPEKDGITQSLLSRFLCCRERFRLLVVVGLRPRDGFNHRLEYGQCWHLCEEHFAQGHDWQAPLRVYAQGLCRKYPLQQEQVQHWYNVCRTQFPLYADYWAKHPDVKGRTPLLQERVFNVPYTIPSGRVVRLRGKWDSVDRIGRGKKAGVYLQENKTKGDIKEKQLQQQLASGFDLQTMLYLVALQASMPGEVNQSPKDLHGVRYNVVRRPLSGGKGSIRKHQPTKSNPKGESDEEFYGRLGGIIQEDPGYFFMRWKVEITPGDIERFRRECLDPILEGLCVWWDWMTEREFDLVPSPFDIPPGGANFHHYRHPYGVWNAMNEGGSSEYDEYLESGSTLGLERTNQLFTELQDGT